MFPPSRTAASLSPIHQGHHLIFAGLVASLTSLPLMLPALALTRPSPPPMEAKRTDRVAANGKTKSRVAMQSHRFSFLMCPFLTSSSSSISLSICLCMSLSLSSLLRSLHHSLSHSLCFFRFLSPLSLSLSLSRSLSLALSLSLSLSFNSLLSLYFSISFSYFFYLSRLWNRRPLEILSRIVGREISPATLRCLKTFLLPRSCHDVESPFKQLYCAKRFTNVHIGLNLSLCVCLSICRLVCVCLSLCLFLCLSFCLSLCVLRLTVHLCHLFSSNECMREREVAVPMRSLAIVLPESRQLILHLLLLLLQEQRVVVILMPQHLRHLSSVYQFGRCCCCCCPAPSSSSFAEML